MSDDEPCIHDLDLATCSICHGSDSGKASQTTLRFAAIQAAVDDLAASGPFRTLDVAAHEAVQTAHPTQRKDPQFNQHIGMYLSGATGRLRIEQVSPKGQSNAMWSRRT